ncbi:alpha-1,6-mannosylglycoprotein 6-beta-N-acetylglucosaminyltransferase B-like [Nematolebias whitei]|uniref:alpha-1,6-mannosylglycoprotein 6-beta-N-acetylglucosaminyltransferase B-like n=1 Tax=Nematolebias whitei TaxID=451745 RepID=UPI00189AED16|nr:alpha-1,6-mannosylglycoprotein 6-beta-N-acetylglucosaminyltransferase B-like [Nematolebias whitei]
MRVALRHRSGCLLLCVGLSLLTLLLQSLWVPPELTRDEAAGRSPEEQSQGSPRLHGMALRLEALSDQVQRLSSKRDDIYLDRNDLSLLLHRLRQDQQSLTHLVERELQRVSQRLEQLSHHHHQPVLLFPGALAGSGGQRFEAMVDRGGPLGELVQWADLSSCLMILGHDVTFSTSQQQLRSLIGAAPGRGSCPIQRPLTFDLIYTDYHGLAFLQGTMGLAFQHYQCRFRILDSFGTEPAFNLGTYARSHGYKTQWGSWSLNPLQYMTMFPHTPDNSFLGFVSEEAVKDDEPESKSYRKDKIAVVYGKQEYMWQGKTQYLEVISEALETHATVYRPPGHSSDLPSFIKNHGLLSQEDFLRLLHRTKVFVGLGFPYEGPAPIEALTLGCVFLQPRFDPPHSSENNDFYKGKPTTRQITSQHPYAEQFIGKPYVWTVNVTNKTDVQQALRSILSTEVKPFTPQEFTCVGMLERLHGYITHQNFCSKSVPAWPPESALRGHLGPLGQSCASVCQRSSLVCEPALFHHLNTPAAFTGLGLQCSGTVQEVNHLFPSYNPWGRHCGLQQEPLLFSCAGSDPSHRRLCPCRAHLSALLPI